MGTHPVSESAFLDMGTHPVSESAFLGIRTHSVSESLPLSGIMHDGQIYDDSYDIFPPLVQVLVVQADGRVPSFRATNFASVFMMEINVSWSAQLLTHSTIFRPLEGKQGLFRPMILKKDDLASRCGFCYLSSTSLYNFFSPKATTCPLRTSWSPLPVVAEV
jgi:hypothetical protein